VSTERTRARYAKALVAHEARMASMWTRAGRWLGRTSGILAVESRYGRAKGRVGVYDRTYGWRDRCEP